MKIAFSGDWHLHSYTGDMVRTLPDGSNSRLQDIISCATWMVEDAKARGCRAFLHGGDLMHSRKSMANEAWSRVAQFMRWMGQQIPTYVLNGNHDLSASGDGTSTVGALDGFFTAVPDVCTTEVGKLKVGWIPYAEDPAQVRQAADLLSRSGCGILIAHLGLGDPRFADCVPVDYETPGRVCVADLYPERFEQVFLSHYHCSHELGPNTRYVGSPLQLSFKEAGHAKGYWVWDDATNAVEFIENTTSPRFRIVDTPADAAKLAHGEVAATDFVWVKNATPDTVEALAAVRADPAMPLMRVDRAPVQRDVTVRVDTASPVRDQLDQYVRHMAPDLTDQQRAARAVLGERLLLKSKG